MHDLVRRARRALIPFLVFAAQAAAGGSAAAATRVPTHVACVGDSITQGVGASSQSTTSYPADLQGLFGSSVQVKNFGHSGATMLSTGDLPYENQSEYTDATTFVQNAGASAVVDVIIMFGTNDTKSYNWTTSGGTRAEQFRTDCAAMVDHFAQLPTHPLVHLALPPAIYTNTYGIDETTLVNGIIPILQQVAATKGALIDMHTPTQNHPELFTDGVHPNDAGYRLVAQVMHDGLLALINGAGGAGGLGGEAAGGHGGGAGAGGHGGAAGGHAGGGGATSTGGNGGLGIAGSNGTGGIGGSAAGGASGRGGTGGSATGGIGSGGSSLAGTAGASGTGGQGARPADTGSSGCSCASANGSSGGAFSFGFLLLVGAALIRRRSS